MKIIRFVLFLSSFVLICSCGHNRNSSKDSVGVNNNEFQSVESNDDEALMKFEKEWEIGWKEFQKALPVKIDNELTLIDGTIANHEIKYMYQIKNKYPEGKRLPEEYIKVRRDVQIRGLKTDPSGQLHKFLKKHDLKIVSEFVDIDKRSIGRFEITYLDFLE